MKLEENDSAAAQPERADVELSLLVGAENNNEERK
jgi:hypothetical protein